MWCEGDRGLVVVCEVVCVLAGLLEYILHCH